MKIFDGLKNMAKGAIDWLVGAEDADKAVVWAPAPPADTSRYLHVSDPLIPVDNEILASMMSAKYIKHSKGHGISYRSLRGECRRSADDLAASMGLNNKQRRRMRSKILARAIELQQEQAA